MKKQQLEQIKIFFIKENENVEKQVNDYVIESYNKNKNFPTIETNSKFISVINRELKEVKE